ncbi:MAG: N-acetylmuramoyl-L-alanine amidase [Candidatus Omnitrophica bacterium]|nr:N-acetylmuramoyl-L-alanine amidase [Candidatus Omnitrophota bacterium]
MRYEIFLFLGGIGTVYAVYLEREHAIQPIGVMRNVQWGALALVLVVAGCATPEVYAPPRMPPARVPARPAGWDVVLDPGHGGQQFGARGRRGTAEKSVTLDIAHRLKRYLEQAGLRVMLTRTGDQTVPLAQRSEIGKRSGAWAFLSIHANAAKNAAASGFEVYYLPDAAQYGRGVAYASTRSLPDASYRLARLIQREFRRDWPLQDRGIKQARFHVLKHTLIPAVLVETGFLTNSRDELLLNDSAAREEIARRLANALLAFRRQGA